jgi:hypothetical protein
MKELHMKLIMAKPLIKEPSPELDILLGRYQIKPEQSLTQKIKSFINGR